MKTVRKLKCHIKEEINPYPKYSYDSGLIEQHNIYHKKHFGIDTDWLLWQLRHNKPISSEDLK